MTRSILPRSELLSIGRISCTRWRRSIGTGLSGWRRENVRSCRVSRSPRWPAPMIASIARSWLGSPSLRRSSSACPLTIIRRLLKSCAMPPVSWPSASIFCICASCSRVRSSCDLGLLALGDVEADAVHADHAAGVVLHQLDTGLDMADLAVRANDPPVAAEPLAGPDRELHLLAHPLAVVRMDALEIAVERAGQFLARLHAENLVELVRPDDLAGFEVAHPAAEIGQALRLDQVSALLIEHVLGVLAAIDLVLRAPRLASVSSAVRAATRRLRSSWTARSSSSLRRRTAASALSARLGTVTPIMKVSSSRNDSLSVVAVERSAAGERAPDRKARQHQCRGRGVARAAAQRRPQQRQHREEAERRAALRGLEDRAEGDQADRAGDTEDDDRFEQLAAVELADVRRRPQARSPA